MQNRGTKKKKMICVITQSLYKSKKTHKNGSSTYCLSQWKYHFLGTEFWHLPLQYWLEANSGERADLKNLTMVMSWHLSFNIKWQTMLKYGCIWECLWLSLLFCAESLKPAAFSDFFSIIY